MRSADALRVGARGPQERGNRFPLYDKAKAVGAFESGNCLIVAPTGTGKSYIGRSILIRSALRGERGVHAYLVPYRALAAEVYESFMQELDGEAGASEREALVGDSARDGAGRQSQRPVPVRVKIATGDHRDPFYPEHCDILVATFERFSALLASPDLRVGRVVVDEIHLLADESRGPALESLLVRLRTWKKPMSICGLSAVISNPEEVAAWLGVPLVRGSAEDRAVRVEFRCDEEKDPAGRLQAEVEQVVSRGEQAIVFCHSKAASQKVAAELRPVVSRYLTDTDVSALREVAARAAADDEEAEDLIELLRGGAAYHHAGLSRDARAAVEAAFRNRYLKVISCTPTLAAGVNLPARLVVVRDVYRIESVRGRARRVVLSTGELLNMLGRAGRPGQVEAGQGVALVEPGLLDEAELSELQLAIRDARGNPVKSRLGDSFDSLMRLVLTVICDRGEATLKDAVDALSASLWQHQGPQPVEFDRPFRDDMMEDIPSFARVDASIRLERAFSVPDGVAGTVASGDKLYNFSLTVSGEDCTCEAKRKWRPRETCKHLACAIHTLLFASPRPGDGAPGGWVPARATGASGASDAGSRAAVPAIDEETRNRALYASAHRFRKTLDLGTKIQIALRLLVAWGLVEQVPGGYRATGVGPIAAHSGLDLLLLRIARDRVARCGTVPPPAEIARWVAEDFFGDETKREKWVQAVPLWIGETPLKKMKLPEKFRGDFERNLEQLGELAMVYGAIAEILGKHELAEACRLTRGCLTYGVAPELIPLAALRIPQLGRARCRALHDERGIKTLEELAEADPRRAQVPGVSYEVAAAWVDTARGMLARRREIAASASRGDEASYRDEADEFLAQFGVDRLVFEDMPGLVRDVP